MPPKVSILLPVHNGETDVGRAIESLLGQTFADFELLVTDDASTDSTFDVISSFDDPRLQVHRNPENLHRSTSLNQAIDRAEGAYLARMDHDDVSLPHRLERQVALLDHRPDIAICGGWIRTTGHVRGSVWRLPADPDEIKARLLFRSVLAHPTVMMRAAAMRAHDLRYRPDQHWSEDWDLWQRAADVVRVTNVPEVVLEYHTIAATDLDAPGMEDRRNEVRGIIRDNLVKLDIEATDDEVDLHHRVGAHDLGGDDRLADPAERWLLRLLEANRVVGRYPEPTFSRVVGEQWFFTCYGLANRGAWAVRRLRSSPLAREVHLPPSRWLKLGVRVLQRRGL